MWRWTDRPAIDARGGHTDEHAAIKARVPIETRLLANLLVQIHVADRRELERTGQYYRIVQKVANPGSFGD
jgi:hypothetical protein